MSASRNKEVFRRVIDEGFNKGNFDAWDDCFPSTYVEHQYGLPANREGFKREVAGLRAAIPDIALTIDEMIEDGEKVWARMTARGTQTGTFMGGPPTGRKFEITVMDVCRFEGGRIVEHWGVPDRFALLRQLGVFEAAPPAASATGAKA